MKKLKRKTIDDAGELAMIKNLLEPDEHRSERPADTREKSAQTPFADAVFKTAAPQYVEVNEAEDLIESPAPTAAGAHDYGAFADLIEEPNAAPTAPTDAADTRLTNLPEPVFAENNLSESNRSKANLPKADFSENEIDAVERSTGETPVSANDSEASSVETGSQFSTATVFPETVRQTANVKGAAAENPNAILPRADAPESFAETARRNGLAYAAALTLFASVVFMLIVGWFADLLFGSSPWGKVGGIALGSLIGFVQLFRITSQIFKDKN